MSDVDTALPDLTPVSDDEAGLRLDQWLSRHAPGLSRTRVKALIEAGLASIDGTSLADPSARVKPGQHTTLSVPEAAPADPQAQDIPLSILYEDSELIVLDKPAGLVVHPAPGSPDQTLVNALLAHCGDSLSGIGGVKRPGIVHRLDKDTSGVMVAAKTDRAHHGLSKQFEDHSLDRAYLALVWGLPTPTQGEITGNIGRSTANRKKMAVVNSGGKTALTRYRVIRTLAGGALSLVECRLATGRTHQIRVHMTAKGHPLIGDPAYGGGATNARLRGLPPEAREAIVNFPRQALHAQILGFNHPVSGQAMRFETPIPLDFACLIGILDKF